MNKILDNIKGPSDLKCLNFEELNMLSTEIRAALLKKLSKRGGHFGPNFGVVELTIALHYVFDSPKDKIVFDVSHQSYVHKILTGRKDSFIKEANYSDVSGYSNPLESEHDLFKIGHTSTSISLACGLAKARNLAGGKENVIAIIGDGSLSGGEAYEGLNNASILGSNFILIVNDNEMSIAENHGGLYAHLSKLRQTQGKSESNIFKDLGFEYKYVEEGNDIETLIHALSEIKDCSTPIVLHVHTQKGKGYSFAEKDQENWHWHPAFNITDGKNIRNLHGENYDDIVCNYLLDKMSKDSSVICIVAGVPLTIGFTKEKRELAGRQFVDVGIAEEHAVAMAAGIAKYGGKPVFATFSSFFQRTYDQVSQELCINKCPATLLVRNGSVWGPNDETHLGIFDIPLLSNIPNLVYLAPTNCEEYLAMLDWSIEQNKYPVAIRIPRNGVHHTDRDIPAAFDDINKSEIVIKGREVAIFALGDFFQMGEDLCNVLRQRYCINATLINPRYITGLDKGLLNRLAETHSVILTMEDGILDGGYGQKIASFYGGQPLTVLNFGLRKEFIDRFSPKVVLKDNGITIDNMVASILKAIKPN